MSSLFGRQLSAWMDLYIYLFCWDLDEQGRKQGYPVEWFLPTFNYCRAVFCDSDDLREELQARYCLSDSQRSRIRTLHTPAENIETHYLEALRHRVPHRGVRRVFWSGRFDRQKRVDLLLAIAIALPDLEFWVWGKAVLNDDSLDLDDLPANIRLMGTYRCIDDVPIAACDCFLYTAGWDGLPTVLIEVGSRGVPVVASAVGGVTDLITGGTGWPVTQHEDAAAYVSAINELLDDYPAALVKAAALRQHVLRLCSEAAYVTEVTEALGLDQTDVVNAALQPCKVSDTSHLQAASSMPARAAQVSAIMTAHAEGALAAVSFLNLMKCADYAEGLGLCVERVVVMDRPDDVTRRVLEEIDDPGVRLIETDYGDQGQVRNFVAEHVSGTYVAFLDGDDLWSENWLYDAWNQLHTDPRDNLIAHPEFNWFFQGTGSILINTDQESELFDEHFLRYANYWDAMCMTRRSTHLAVPYCRRRIAAGFAFEDWHWNCETLLAGFVHKTVADTIHFKRRRSHSQTTQASANRSTIPETRFTDYARWA
jgi:hypothetical protein